ncbi:ABC transporter ATP-binding protein [Streptococcus pneumoniae]|jgi:ATPase components of ABC transporters with duplicated ATPase domains|uniref:ABC transporter domain-containing protein n=6 Tax=Streptococcus pneumoniae TaxID=1313 RepID=Q8DPT2_STRR6|nr:ABC-F family ATP-binding cassette domain-containing protein [Streptococcus pneumoniae]EHD55889.1 ABC transporter family protein [Streptococcus pneumoniae NP070]EHD83867.1 ABC transporter family protein [Streptococcus pneumoniae GA07643]EJG68740.1 ABC transporter family protein [Streptococcus pneumoniae 2081074]EJG74223.1 ABC transporter family protein [Streptococcus pneumoniae 2082170]EJG78831.1 ABC transporter family protein [Streptococcus pneumoniae SPAR27]EJG79390.1 ABC transporter fami
MIILQANKIERSFAGEVLFDNINLQVDERDRIALVGKNGAGKSTLLKILVGEEEPTSGEINKKKDISLSYLAQDSRFESENTIYDEMLHVFNDLRRTERQLRQMELEMGEKSGEDLDKLMSDYDRLSENFRQAGGFTYEADIRAILNGFKFDESMWQMKIAELSGGQNTRLALAKMLLEKPNLLVLDEPTNHLDIETIAWLENYLVNYSGALIIVSHDRYFLDKVATITLDLTKHSLDRYVGNYSRFVELKEQKLVTEAKNYEKQQKEIAALEDFVNRNLVRASTTKRAQSRRKQLEKMERLDKPEAGKKSANMTFQSEKTSGNVVLTVENAAVGYDGEVLSQPINLDLRKMNAVAIVGPNGIGKSTFIKSIVDQIPFIKGEKRFGANVEVGYYDQTQSKLTPSNTVLDELWNDFKLTPEVEIRNRLGAFLFSGDDVKKSVGMLSGGEKARLLLAKLSMENNNFLILDEPTNHLDIDSKEVLENALIDFDGTLLFVSHDRYFINRVATHVLELSENGSTLYLGDYDYYVEKKATAEMSQTEEASTSNQAKEASPVNDYQAQKESQKEVRKLMRQIESLEAEIEELESQSQAISEQMLETNDADKLMELQAELDKISHRQEEAMLEWEELSEQV